MTDAEGRIAARAMLDRVAARVLARDAVAWSRMFGSEGVSVRGKVFAFVSSAGQLVVKLPEERVGEIADSGIGAVMVMRGRPMREWATLPPGAGDAAWQGVVEEAYAFVDAITPR